LWIPHAPCRDSDHPANSEGFSTDQIPHEAPKSYGVGRLLKNDLDACTGHHQQNAGRQVKRRVSAPTEQ
jgi:hypothetical protein